jgi:TolA-binding protein
MKTRTISATAAAMFLIAGSVLAQPADSPEDSSDMARMNETMERIRSVEDPEQRAQLLEQHLDEMHDAMAHMHHSMGQLMQQVEAQRTERRRLHDHRRMK